MATVNQMVQERNKVKETPVIKVGSKITYKDPFGKKHTYTIVTNHEMDIKSKKISASAPLAQAVLGKLPGETTVVKAPGSEYEIEIIKTS